MTSPRDLLRRISIVGLVGLFSAAVFLAVDDEGLFELGDSFGGSGTGDIVGSPGQAGCDWADLFDANPTDAEIASAVESCGGVAAAFLADPLSQGGSTDDTSFSGGASKNDQPVANWRWSSGSSPSKDDLSNFYTFATLDADGDLVIYAGIERLAANGDSHIDFEFNQSAIDLDKPAPCGADQSAGPSDGPPCEFVGEKTDGDLLVNVDFRRGGRLGTVEVRRWNGSAYALVEALGGEGCNGARTVCAYSNGGSIDGGPWPNYDANGNVVQTLPRNAFTEIGVNVTALFDRTPCFVGVMAKSRASSSLNSTLKDFARSGFTICSFTIDKGGASSNPDPKRSKIGDDFTFHYELENTGAATLHLVSVIDSFLGDITDEAIGGTARAGCGTLAPRAQCSFDVVSSIPKDADDPFDTSVRATYTDTVIRGATTVVSVEAGDAFPLNLFQPSVDVEKTGDTLSTAGNVVNYSITVNNTGSADSPVLANGTIVDTLLGDLLDPDNPFVVTSDCTDTLPTGTSCTIQAARTVAPGDPDPLPNTVTAHYNPAGGFPNDITDSDDHAVDLVAPSASFVVSGMPNPAARGNLVTYTFTIQNTGDVALERIGVSDTLLGDLGAAFPAILPPGGSVDVAIGRVVAADDPDPLLNSATATYRVAGLPNEVVRTASFSLDILAPCALSPGFWKGGSGVPLWDDLQTDPIAQAAGFATGTPFPWVAPSLAGTTYLGVLNLSAQGDVTRQLSFKYVAARLNQAAFGVPPATAQTLSACDAYLAANPVGSDPRGAAAAAGQGLLAALNDYFAAVGEAGCP